MIGFSRLHPRSIATIVRSSGRVEKASVCFIIYLHALLESTTTKTTSTTGGSSAMNFLFWSKPPTADIDAWEELGNPGWNWDNYLKYTLRTEQ